MQIVRLHVFILIIVFLHVFCVTDWLVSHNKDCIHSSPCKFAQLFLTILLTNQMTPTQPIRRAPIFLVWCL